jgi:NO-binding membrane sensor protein with MHYT domain
VLHVRSFADGPLIPLLSYVASFVGVFLGLRCATRARACPGASRGRWLLLAAVAIGSTGIWAMDFLALLGFSVVGETTRYNVVIALASLLVAVVAAGAGLLIISVDRGEDSALPVGGLIVFGLLLGAGLTVAHYLAMAAMRMPVRLSYDPVLVVLSFVIAVAAATGILLGATRLRGAWPTLGASLGLGALLCGMHYTAMAAVLVSRASRPAGLVVGGAGSTAASSLLLPVILSVSIVAFLVCASIALSPTEDAIRYDAALLDRIRKHTETPFDARTAVLRPSRNVDGVPLRNGMPVWNGGTASGRDTAFAHDIPFGNDTPFGDGTRPGNGTRLGNGTPFGPSSRPGNGTSPGRGPIPGQGRLREDDPAPGRRPDGDPAAGRGRPRGAGSVPDQAGPPEDGPVPGPGPAANQPPWAIGEPRQQPEPY